ncbi:uncharacterized protein PADG_06991 [Paracoccidioides brasiliensis Pb18]|uniref:Up-regulated during septation protein 1 domain-containing protein n=2 Tax=Paracoccidioides brasiliensis TaxID=121759 RepID=C1GIA5_PARBD|nr:uncharacterized protein PADG_06991 [Paracoccidioides brasiliensis Pb18]EEH42171.2 hypothetical protein PADG_06991 [Paracoccidioides brasiliensis Pb18]ODH38266.1 hypothetical protein ACO22_02449 [Paracoccidioides brasiliensis]
MHAVEQKVHEFAAHVGLNIPRNASPTLPNVKAQCSLNIGVSGMQSSTERFRYQLWPSLKKTAAAEGRRTPDLSDLKKNPFKEGGTLHRRRKISVPELGLMTTVQETFVDSPTIPGKFPSHERSNSAPGTSWGRGTFGNSALDPVGEPPSASKESFGKVIGRSALDDCGHKSGKRTSSLLLPNALDAYPLAVDVIETSKASSPIKSLEQNTSKEEEPPAVPPKSPRLGLRIPPTEPMTNYSNSSPSSFDTTLAMATNCAPADNSYASGFISPLKTKKSGTNLASLESAHPSTTQILPGTGRQSSLHTRNRSAGVCQTYQNTNMPAPILHRKYSMPLRQQQNFSPDSMSWGQPPRNESPIDSPQAQHVKKEPIEDGCLILPAGIPAHTAPKLLSQYEIERLRIQAREQATRFEVLKYSEVRSLSRELRALDKRCNYLRETHISLRSGRHSLHKRMISYLKSPRVSKFTREGILKQEEALSELDQSIDEWVFKLDQAENRRNRVRQKLLEHIAGALLLRNSYSEDDILGDDQTPPRSPSKMDSPPSSRCRDVESIKVYADAELRTLFANIEKEMERMANSDTSTSLTTEVGA